MFPRLRNYILSQADRLRHELRLRRWDRNRAIGRWGEDLAHRYLRSLGYVIVARNYRTRSFSGEADLVAWDGDTLVFVEVKTRSSGEVAAPDRNVGRQKEIHLRRAARDYATRAEVPWEQVRCDVVSIVLGNPPEIELRRNAFNLDARLS